MARPNQPKPIDRLRDDDLRRHSIWCFADDVEGDEDQDETSVEPVEATHVPRWSVPLFVVANFVAPDGTEFLGLVAVSSAPDVNIQPCAIVTSQTYAPLPGSGDRMANEVLSFTELELNRTRQSLYPLTYTLRVLVEDEAAPRSGRFDLPAADA